MGFERLTPGTREWQSFYANHIFRYEFALKLLSEEKKVRLLDAACGVGFGSNYLASHGSFDITAIDRNDLALSISNDKYAHPQIRYLKDDCDTLLKASAFGPYDAVVSIETLEHLPNPEAFLKACYANLNENGFLFVTTPNATVTSPDGNVKWEFHEKEYTEQELIKILEKNNFRDIKIYGQGYSSIGKLRDNVRSELNRMNSNPFARFGRFIQKITKSYRFPAVLPEQVEDFSIIDSAEFQANPPFVLMAVARK